VTHALFHTAHTHATVRASLTDTHLPRLETRLLWQHVLGCTHAWLIAHDTDPLPPAAAAQFQALRARRLRGEPMAYLLGTREFMGHDFIVCPDVLIPRPETELLVETALQTAARLRAQHKLARVRVLELGVGSGAVAISLALADANLDITATDISAAALAVAQQNARHLGAHLTWYQGNWYQALPQDAQYDMIVSNPPYIAHNDDHLSTGDLRFEPQLALTDGAGGMDALRAIIAGAHHYLAPGGALWLEHGWDQAEPVRALLRQAKFDAVCSLPDLSGIARVSGGFSTTPNGVNA